jgi:hypothetical protein
MSGIARYRALVNCRAGGAFRNAGEEFDMPVLEELPPFLELVESAKGEPTSAAEIDSGGKASKPPASKKPPRNTAQSTGATKKDLGIGEPTSAAEIDSADMVKK